MSTLIENQTTDNWHSFARYGLARKREQAEQWRDDKPENKYAMYFVLQLAILTGEWKEALQKYEGT